MVFDDELLVGRDVSVELNETKKGWNMGSASGFARRRLGEEKMTEDKTHLLYASVVADPKLRSNPK